MTETTRASTGGFEWRFDVERSDGKPIHADRRYIVLDYSGADPAGVAATLKYADEIESLNPVAATDIRRNVADPANAPAQHRYAGKAGSHG